MGLSESSSGIVAEHALYADLATATTVVLFIVAAVATLATVTLAGHAGAQLTSGNFPN